MYGHVLYTRVFCTLSEHSMYGHVLYTLSCVLYWNIPSMETYYTH